MLCVVYGLLAEKVCVVCCVFLIAQSLSVIEVSAKLSHMLLFFFTFIPFFIYVVILLKAANEERKKLTVKKYTFTSTPS